MTGSQQGNEAIFHAARDISNPERRREYVRDACGLDEARIAHVEALLAAADTPDSLLDRPAVSDAVPTSDQPTTGLGTVIGPYKLIEKIGEGGMGTVWMAQQSEPVKRLVALKLIKAGMDSRQVIARFEAERQALALMDHPNIARVLDGGTTPFPPSPLAGEGPGVRGGLPYFVMDLVRGVPITRYCDEHHLTPRERLELFLPVCQAIQHAHQKGIIHRDLKPTNVLVALYDGRPVPKVIDFGVAKAAGQPLTEQTLVTGFGAIVGTLEYMSPEQAELNQLDIDTRSDIYSLGVLLYELLTGSPPFSRKELEKAGMLEMLRVIREEEPEKPSTRLSESRRHTPCAVQADGTRSVPTTLASIAAVRGTEPAKLTKLIRGELDWIVMKALEKDRGRRYETAAGFAADINRYLDDEPVQACPPSAWYRFRKFVRRHQTPVVAASLVFLALICGVFGTTWGLILAEQQRVVVERQRNELAKRNRALQAARDHERLLNERARQAIEADVTEAALDQLTREQELTPEQEDFLNKMIQYYAEAAQDVAATEQERSRQEQAYFRMGRMNQVLGRAQGSENAYRRAVALGRQLVGDFPAQPEHRHQLAENLNNLGSLLLRTNRLPEAETAFVEAAALYRKLAAEFQNQSEFRQALAGILHNLGNVLCETNRLPEAETTIGESLAIRKQLAVELPKRPILRRAQAMSHNSLGWLYQLSNRLLEAEAAYAESLALYKQLDFDADFPNRPEFRMELATSQRNLGNVLALTNRPKEAEAAHAEAVTIFRQLVAEYPNRPEFRKELADAEAAQARAVSK